MRLLSVLNLTRTLDSDVGDAAAVVTHLHVKTVQHSKQFEAEDVAIFGSFSCCRGTSSLSEPQHES